MTPKQAIFGLSSYNYTLTCYYVTYCDQIPVTVIDLWRKKCVKINWFVHLEWEIK